MPPEAAHQCKRVFEYFKGPENRQRYEAMVHYAEWQVRRWSWSAGKHGTSLPNGKTGRDVLHEVVADVSTIGVGGKCIRSFRSEIPVEVAIRWIINSKVSHSFESTESRLRSDSVATVPGGEEIDLMESAKPFWNPSGDRMSAETRTRASERSQRFLEFARGDRVVYGMLILLRDEDLEGPAQTLAEGLGVDINEIYTSRKRLATLVRRFRESGDKIDERP